MGKTIIIAGAGHGGLASGALLAEKGFDVTVYEKKKEYYPVKMFACGE